MRGLLLAAMVFGLADAARGDEVPDFCSSQRQLANTYLSPRTSQSVGSAVVTFKLGEGHCYFCGAPRERCEARPPTC